MDKNYWNTFYKNNPPTQRPSPFAEFVLPVINREKEQNPQLKLCELGCGNGRDSIFFANSGFECVAIDASVTAIEIIRKQEIARIDAYVDDFTDCSIFPTKCFDVFYSRFTLHSIDERQEKTLLQNVYDGLNNNGLFFIEARSIKDDIFGRGEPAGRNAFFYNGHFRRFIVKNELENCLKALGFKIEFTAEERGFATHKQEDPFCIRVIARKAVL